MPRVLVIDDEPALHEDYARCLAQPLHSSQLDSARDALFGTSSPVFEEPQHFALTHASSGREAVEHVRTAVAEDAPFCVAFVDMRMPPGWSGVETISQIWRVDDQMQIVLCTAYSDFTWDAVIAGVGRSDGLHLLRKPFAADKVRRFADVLAKKWQLSRGRHLRGAP